MNKILTIWDEFLTIIIRIPKLSHWVLPQLPSINRGLSIREQVIFLKRLAMMLRAQMPIVLCLEMMAQESISTNLKSISANLAKDISNGQSLGSALQRYKKTFSFFCISLVTVGEQSGTLSENLEYIAVELKKKSELRAQIVGALIYPAIVVLATIAITVFLVVYIFPKIVPIFLSIKTTLPWSTRILMWVSDLLSTSGWYILGILIFVVLSVPFIWQIPQVSYLSTKIMLRLPIIGTLFSFYNLAQVTRTLGLLLQNEVPIVAAIGITATSTGNVVYRKTLFDVQRVVKQGKKLSLQLKNTPALFPALVIQMVEAGEQTGNLPTTLTYVSELYESDIKDLTKTLTTVVEPVLMLFMGIIVGFIAISIITPIYGITQNLHQ